MDEDSNGPTSHVAQELCSWRVSWLPARRSPKAWLLLPSCRQAPACLKQQGTLQGIDFWDWGFEWRFLAIHWMGCLHAWGALALGQIASQQRQGRLALAGVRWRLGCRVETCACRNQSWMKTAHRQDWVCAGWFVKQVFGLIKSVSFSCLDKTTWTTLSDLS